MILEVFKRGRTIGFVVTNDRLTAYDMVRKSFPQVDKVNVSYHLPKEDKRCKQIAENIYSWSMTPKKTDVQY